MKEFKYALIPVLTLCIGYLSGAFIDANFLWLEGMFTTWENRDRTGFLILCTVLGGWPYFSARLFKLFG